MRKSSIRRNTISGEVPFDGLADGIVHFTEWNNGEGFDFELTDPNYKNSKSIELHSDEIKTIAAISMYLGYLNLEELLEEVNRIENDEEKAKRDLAKFKSDIQSKSFNYPDF
jgi:hypothetical protein